MEKTMSSQEKLDADLIEAIISTRYTYDTEKVKSLIENDANVNSTNSYKSTPLHLVDRLIVAQMLIDAGADVNRVNNDGYTPLHTATNPEIVNLLIESGANVNARDNLGLTPLHLNRYPEITEILIKAGADVNAVDDEFGRTPLHLAQARNCYETSKALIDGGSNVNSKDKYGITPLHCWSHERYGDKNDVNPLWVPEQFFRSSIRIKYDSSSYKNIVKLFAESGADLNATNRSGETVLIKYIVCLIGRASVDIDFIKLMVENGANVNLKDSRGNSAVDWAYDVDNELGDTVRVMVAKHELEILEKATCEALSDIPPHTKKLSELTKDSIEKHESQQVIRPNQRPRL